VQQFDAANDRDHTLDRVAQIFTRSIGMTRIEAEADPDIGRDGMDRVPESGEVVEPPRDRVPSACGVLDEEGDGRLKPLERPQPSSDTLLDSVFCVAGMDDHRRGAHIGRSVARLLEEPAPESATGRDGRADIDEVGGMHVDGQRRRLKRGGVWVRRRLLEALRVGHEDLDAIRAERFGLREWVNAWHVSANARV
jgi:hypothetical protein